MDITRREFIEEMKRLKAEDPAKFMKTVFDIMKKYPDLAISDDAPLEKKAAALDRMVEHFVGLEEYEACAYITDLKKKIEDGGKE
jgi:tellurite resistance protein